MEICREAAFDVRPFKIQPRFRGRVPVESVSRLSSVLCVFCVCPKKFRNRSQTWGSYLWPFSITHGRKWCHNYELRVPALEFLC